MKGIVIALALVSSAAWACPDLTGTYTCTYDDQSKETIVMSQELKNGITYFNYNGSEVIADNLTYPVPDDATMKQGTFRAWCENGLSLRAEMLGKYHQNDQYIGDIGIVMDVSLNDNNLLQVTSGALKTMSAEYPIAGTVSCVRVEETVPQPQPQTP